MRLAEDQIRQGILHPDPDVRYACIRYFAEGSKRSTSVMPVVIEALERFGRTGAFRFPHLIAGLAQTPETIQWAIRELQRGQGPANGDKTFADVLSRLVTCADPKLIEPHVAAIQAAPGFVQSHTPSLGFRIEILRWSSVALWNELERICEDGKGTQSLTDFPYDRATDVVEALARHGDQVIDRMTSLLNIQVDDFENNSMTWMEPLVVRLAGELRHESSVPVILGKLSQDADLVNEESQIALGRIGSDEVVEAIRDGYPTSEWCFRLYTAGALGRIRSDLAVQTAIELLKDEDDPDLQDCLGQSLSGQFSFEGNEAARKVFLRIPESCGFQTDLVAACTLMGQGFPELEDWRREIASRRHYAFVLDGPYKGVFKTNGSAPH